MRYYTYVHPGPDGVSPEYIEMSEEDIRREYYSYWETQMIKKYGEAEYRARFSFEDCLEDFMVVHWAWVSNKLQ